MRVHETLTLPLSANGAAAMYADPAYAEIRRDALGANDATSSVDGDPAGAFTVRTELVLPTDRVPEVARRFVGSRLTVHEEQSWSAPAGDGSRTGRNRLEVAGMPAGMEAAVKLVPAGDDSCTLDIDGDLTAKVPLIGGRLEKAALPYISSVLKVEQKAAATYRDRRV